MISTTPEIRRAIQGLGSLQEKIAFLKDRYRGRRCILLTCGPSLSETPAAVVREYLKGEFVIAVKQAYRVSGPQTDIHLLNLNSAQRYAYCSPRPIVILEQSPGARSVWQVEPDMVFQVGGTDKRIPRAVRLANRLAVTEEYDRWLLSETVDRPWGPGIILELGMYLAVLVGASELIVAGWDLGPPDVTIYEHFYERRSRWSQGRVGSFIRRLARRGPFLAMQYVRHRLGHVYYRGTVEPDDTAVSVASSYGMSQWLRSKGVALTLVSTQSHLDPRIPRANWETALGLQPSSTVPEA